MDIMLFALSLLTFAILYLALTFFLFWAIVITLLVIMIYLSIRWRSVSENYPYGINDSIILIALLAVSWMLFVFLGPKNPVYFLGNGLTYGSPDWGTVAAIMIIFLFVVLIVFSLLIPYLQGRMGMIGGGGGGDDGKGKVGVGAG